VKAGPTAVSPQNTVKNAMIQSGSHGIKKERDLSGGDAKTLVGKRAKSEAKKSRNGDENELGLVKRKTGEGRAEKVTRKRKTTPRRKEACSGDMANSRF